ncbi:MAG: hypothetical protein Q9200_005232 [Gallowayella weberi]
MSAIRTPQPPTDAPIAVCDLPPPMSSTTCLECCPKASAHVDEFRVNEQVIIRLKWGQTEYKGRLVSVDSYMNIQLAGTEEFIDGESKGSLGQVLIRYVCVFERVGGGSQRRGVTTFFGYQVRRPWTSRWMDDRDKAEKSGSSRMRSGGDEGCG